MHLHSGNCLALAERTDCIDICLTFACVRIGFATKCAMCGDSWAELVGVWGRGLLAVGLVVWAFRADESAVVVVLVRASDRTENMSYR